MSLKDTLRNKLDSELYTKVIDALGDNFNYDVVPRKRLNDVIEQRDSYRDQLEALGGSQAAGGKEDDDPDDDPKGKDSGKGKGTQPSAQPSQQKAVDEEALRKQFQEEKDNAILELKVQYAGLDALREAGCVDPELAFGLLDKSKLTFGDDKKLTGIQEQIEGLKGSKAFLFGANKGGRQGTPGGTGKEGGSGKFETVSTKEDFLKLSTNDQAAFKEAHPDMFKKFLNEF